jgi:hypothetical protein
MQFPANPPPIITILGKVEFGMFIFYRLSIVVFKDTMFSLLKLSNSFEIFVFWKSLQQKTGKIAPDGNENPLFFLI